MTNKASFLKLLSKEYEQPGILEGMRKNALRTEIKVKGMTYIVDTIMAPDTCEYETGIYDNIWHIVEQYGDVYDNAKKGHEKWCNKVKKGFTTFDDVLAYEW